LCAKFAAIVVALLGVYGSSRQAAGGGYGEDRPKPVRWPGEGGKKVIVNLGIVVVEFARINLREESFDMAGYLDTSWTDPALALKSDEKPDSVRRYRPGQIWAPALEFVNAVEQVPSEREGDLYVADDGQVTQRVRFSHKFQSTLRLERFPFDYQTLTIVVASFDPTARDLILAKEPNRVGRLEEASVPDWTIIDTGARIAESPTGDPSQRRFLFDVEVRRKSTFYLWRVLIPLTLLVLASWTVFWFEPTNLQPQISTSLAILLSFVTFNYAIDFSLPKVAYLTFSDRYILTSFGFVLSVTFAVAILHVVLRKMGDARAARLQA
jgi:hypothetical protein